MNRRTFLLHSGSILLSTLIGSGSWSKVLAMNDPGPSFQPRIAVIIDDIGYSRSQARRFWELGVPLTFAILPRLEKSSELAREIHARGHEIMLHQPMEPHESHLDPGPGAIYVGFGPERIREVLEENLAVVPFASGVNNHMGSRLTESPREVQAVLRVVEKNALFFVDSLTSCHSVAYREASNRRMPAACRNIFLDHYRNESYILRQLFFLEHHARSSGEAIGIGHPYPETASALARYLKAPHDPGRFLVYISMVIRA